MSEPLIITTEMRDDHQLAMTIELGPERTAQALHRAARAVSQKARIPGFRPGKAPDATVFRIYGRETVLREIMEDLSKDTFEEALEIHQIQPYGQANLEKVETDPIRFSLVIPMPPGIELGDYAALRLPMPAVTVTDADVDALIEQARTEQAALAPSEGPVQIGDTVVIDITGTVGEETIMDNHDWELVLKGESGWLPGFDEAFVGMSAGDEKRFTLIYPADSASRYKGQAATFQAKVSAMKTQAKPEMTDEFARSLGDFESVADMRTKLFERLTAQRQRAVEEMHTDQAVQALISGATVVYPPNVLEAEQHAMLHEFEHQVIEAGYKLEDYLRLQGLTPESYQERVRPQAERRVTSRLVLTELMRREKIEVSDEEIQAETARMHSLVGEGEKAQKTHAMFDSETGQVAIQQDLLTKKTLARLREIVTAEPAPEASLETAVVETPAEIAAASEPVEAESGATQPVAEEPAGEPNGNPANNE